MDWKVASPSTAVLSRASAKKPRRRWLSLLLVALISRVVSAQGEGVATEAAVPTEPGLVAAYAGSGGLAHTLQRLPALHVREGESPAAGLESGAFTAVFVGFLNLDLRTRLTFSAEGRGRVRVSVRGQVVLDGEGDDLSLLKSEAFRIRKGANPLLIEYTAPHAGPAILRLCWQSDDFVREPIPAEAFTHACDETHARAAQQLRRGRELFAALRCINCHEPDSGVDLARATFGLGAAAPSLAGLGERVNAEWIARWILEPDSRRPGAHMPRVLPEGLAAEAALELARSIAKGFTQDASPAASALDPDQESAMRGGALIADLGCNACHVLPGETPAVPETRVTLKEVAAKFRPGALATFVQDPTQFYPATRMPKFALSAAEAADIEAHLRSLSPPAASTDGTNVTTCSASQYRCQQCHDPRPDTMLPATPLAGIAGVDWSETGCASAKATSSMARYALPTEDRHSLESFRKAGVQSAFRTSAQERSHTAVRELRCQACHVLDGVSDLWSLQTAGKVAVQATSTAESLSQTRPELSYIGEKLHQPWVRRVLAGDSSTRMRPWLRARMPAFPAHADLLARGLADQHGWPETSPRAAEADAETLRVGAWLVSRDGFGCTACHWLGDQAPYATFEFGATDLTLAGQRLRQDHALRWLWKPQRIVKGSRMPSYATASEPITAQDGIWDGDAHRQFHAIWAWLSSRSAQIGTPPGK